MNMPILAQSNANTNQVTMSSLEIVDFVNEYRAKNENNPVQLQHSDFLKKVPLVLGKDAGNFSSIYKDSMNREKPCYRFPKREACLMAMSYSYELQAQVFDRMTAMEEALKKSVITLPNFADPAEAAIAWANEYKAKQLALADAEYFKATKAEIGSRREATAMGRLSAKSREVEKLKTQLDSSTSFATIKKVQSLTGGTYDTYALRRHSKANHLEVQKAEDANYGSVNSYHKDAWLAVYNINLSSLNGAA